MTKTLEWHRIEVWQPGYLDERKHLLEKRPIVVVLSFSIEVECRLRTWVVHALWQGGWKSIDVILFLRQFSRIGIFHSNLWTTHRNNLISITHPVCGVFIYFCCRKA
jgi:hypothetical protein